MFNSALSEPVYLEKIQREYLELVDDHFQLLQTRFGERLRSVCVFGSVATSRAGPESDIDVLVVVDAARLFERNADGDAEASDRTRKYSWANVLRL
ncbi:MAG: nucleotidyltransferase domain-containing protein [Thaumarchaeota archaeon]|nr:nucleotidyltransferase domain-containing protein [Candidatus Calditenuaceae archaeon]MDW8186499.1 nucleotidyltransferase domain-containing protein [Nitrososphaerota archaeon]